MAAVTSSTVPADPQSSTSSLASVTSQFLETTRSITSTARQQWISGQIQLNDAQASIDSILPAAQNLKYALDAHLQTPALRELITAELRYYLASSLGDLASTSPHVETSPSSIITVYAILDATTAYQLVELVDDGLTLTFIEEINERLTVDSACQVFEYLESRVAFLTAVSHPKHIVRRLQILIPVLIVYSFPGPLTFPRQRARLSTPIE